MKTRINEELEKYLASGYQIMGVLMEDEEGNVIAINRDKTFELPWRSIFEVAEIAKEYLENG